MIPAAFAPLAAHLWQSTLFAAVAGLLTVALRRNQARVRYWLWLAASYKFLIPFSWLVSIGHRLEWRAAPAIMPHAFSAVTDMVSDPIFLTAVPAAKPAPDHLPLLLFSIWAVWACGFVAVVSGWAREWLRIRAIVRAASPLQPGLPISAPSAGCHSKERRDEESLLLSSTTAGEILRCASARGLGASAQNGNPKPFMHDSIRIVSTAARLEPGVVGIFRPVLVLPEGIAARLTQAQLQAVLAHELCHVRRRDNLAAAVHMLVEALFWFYPLVWWLGARLIDERERACDEEVLQSGSPAQVYAESILKVCEFYLESPLTCVSGITGSCLKKRIEEIMRHRTARKLDSRRKLLLVAAAMLAVIGPILVGTVETPRLRAQSQSQSEHLAFEVASVKPNNSTDFLHGQLQFLPGGKLVIRNIPLRTIVATAYNLPLFQSPRLTGGQEWEHVALERYDIEATAEQGAITPGLSTNERNDKIRLMLQSLLKERFKLNMLSKPKEQPVYALVVAKGGPKLQKSKIQEKDCVEGPSDPQIGCHIIGGGQGRGIHGDAVDIADVALWVQNWTDLPVVDKTGLTDLYNIQTNGWVPMLQRQPGPDGTPQGGDAGLYDPDRQTLSDVFRQLGLRMESQRAVVDMFVVDHVEEPSPN